MSSQQALDRLTEATNVEAAFRTQASRAVERYNIASAYDPYSAESETAWKLRKEALSQWAKARQDLEEAQRAWKLAHAMDSAAARRGAVLWNG